jgi:hypothetical protein
MRFLNIWSSGNGRGITMTDLEDRSQQLRMSIIDLEEAQGRVLKLGRLDPAHGGITCDEMNSRTAKIAAERKPIDSELAALEKAIAEATAAQPVEFKSSHLTDIITLFEFAFTGKTPPPAAIAALERLRTLSKGENQ